MPKINLLPKEISELIAAGEVVERPASVIKELVENSVDAGAKNITVEIQHGGITYIRITDDGCGISHDDVPLAFLRHATSKIKLENDLNAISTLGFRGEALAAISSVSRVEIFTKTAEETVGTHYIIEGGNELLNEESGCPDGTTIIIRDIFFNTPARMKFLKKDVSEANAVAAVADRIALSRPEIAFKLIRDGRQTLNTDGNGDLKGTVYSVLGREFASSLISVGGEQGAVSVSGLISKPVNCKPTRNSQYVFLNKRLVRSGTVTAAAEQAYKNSTMVGKFPGFVLYVNVPFETVDVNVHPAKTEVRFSDERIIFDAVYYAVKNALNAGDTRPEIKLKQPVLNSFAGFKADKSVQQPIESPTVAEKVYNLNYGGQKDNIKKENGNLIFKNDSVPLFMKNFSVVDENGNKKMQDEKTVSVAEKTLIKSEPIITENELKANFTDNKQTEKPKEQSEIILIGEAFGTYIIVQKGESVFMIDKHAAHERIIFNSLKNGLKSEAQALLSPVAVTLPKEEYNAVISNLEKLEEAGFETEDFGNSTVLVSTVPPTLADEDISAIMGEMAESLIKTSTTEIQKLERLYETVACKAAIKAGFKTGSDEMKHLACRVLGDDDIMYCPHGRPVAFEIKKRELEKKFGRIQ